MKNILLLISLVILTISCSKQQIVITEDQIPEDKFYYTDPMTPYTGKCVVLYNNSQKVKEVMFFKNGLLNGSWTCYYADGMIKQKGEYRNGMFNGKWESWSELGNKLYEVHYVNDSLSGKYTTWHKTGKMKEKGAYLNNERTGDWSWYNETGDLIEKSNYEIN
jgi:antitoxin component YwqK of YwqJK toxin-antitoxin module